MTDPDDQAREARPNALAATRALDPGRLALAATQDSRASGAVRPGRRGREDSSDPSFGLVDTRAPGPEELVTERSGAAAVGQLDTVDSGPRDRLGRPALDDPEERRRRQALKARLFGDADDAVKIGRFQVLGRLGAGGMGVVYAAYDELLDRKVAIKVLRRESGHSRVRLQREAQAMARLSHPNIVGVYEVFSEGEDLVVAMEFVRGQSLDRWLEEPRPWRTVLEVFVAAGRGLQAAHEAGLIHRDFKPANAILGEDGRVKVLDFGLARTGADAAEADRGGDGSLMKIDLTQTGAMLGTPAYMSPEQFNGEALTAASDQFSFFVALYEALYRTQAFAGDSVGTLALSVTRGRPNDPPTRSEVPPWVRAAVLRGLARAPEGRFPDMAAALAALSMDPARRRRRLAAALGLVLVSGGASAAAVRAADGDGGRCEGVAAASEAVWNDERAASSRAAFAGSGGAFGEETWALVEPRIAAWVGAWNERRAERCAAYAAGRLSDTLHDRSVACLERQLARLDGVVDAFVVADARMIEQATTAVAALPSVALCGDAEMLLAEVPPPDDPRARALVAEGYSKLEQARAAIDLGRYDRGLDIATEVSAQAGALGYRPLVALAEVVRGDAFHWQWDGPGAEEALTTGLADALASGDDRVAVEALARRIFVRAEVTSEPERALADAEIGRALVSRVGADVRLAWLMANNTAVAQERQGMLAEAASGYQDALRIAKGLDGPSSEAVASQYNRGQLDGQSGRMEEAVDELVNAVAAAEALHGPNHPMLMFMLDGAANAMVMVGRDGEATALCRRARALAGRLAAPHPALAAVLASAARVAAVRRQPDAQSLADEAEEAARGLFGPDNPRTAYALLRAQVHRDEREADVVAATAVLRATGPQGWAQAMQYRVHALLISGRPARAFELVEAVHADELWKELPGRSRVFIARAEAEALIRLGRTSDAERVLDAIEVHSDDPRTGILLHFVDFRRGQIAAANGDTAAAVVLLRRAVEGYARTFDADHPEYLEVRAALARALRASGQTSEAAGVARGVLAGYRSLGPGFAREADELVALFPGS